jgi:poly(3-hydroxybutyrate) depolymerase
MKNPLMYQAYQMYADLTKPIHLFAQFATPVVNKMPFGGALLKRLISGACDVTTLLRLTHARPPFNIASVLVNGTAVAIEEEFVAHTEFCSLLHFKKQNKIAEPRVLVVAPMSGHFATLLRETVMTLLRDHDVYITDWHNIRDIPLSAGDFGLDEFTEHIIYFLEQLGGGTHLMAVCQPTVSALIATAIMAEDDHPAQPPTLTLMAGPIDTRINPTEVNKLAATRSIDWFEDTVVGTVPLRYRGALRKVYPGFLQISAFMSMNIGRHVNSVVEMYANLVREDHQKAEATREFYEEYFAMMDLSAKFYLETVQRVFQEHHLPLGTMTFRDRVVDLTKIQRTALLTIEGEKDDICAVGQTMAAQDLCTAIPPSKRRHYVQTGVGHYGVFSGRRWDKEVYPVVRDFMYLNKRLSATRGC